MSAVQPQYFESMEKRIIICDIELLSQSYDKILKNLISQIALCCKK